MPSSDRSGKMQMTHSSGCTSPTEFEDEGDEGEKEGVEIMESDKR